jgi:hypothetical protein
MRWFGGIGGVGQNEDRESQQAPEPEQPPAGARQALNYAVPQKVLYLRRFRSGSEPRDPGSLVTYANDVGIMAWVLREVWWTTIHFQFDLNR